MDTQIAIVAPSELEASRPGIVAAYAATFSEAPYFADEAEVESFSRALSQHAKRPPVGFRCCVAREAATGEIVGFGYGYRPEPGQWRYNTLSAALSDEQVARWLDNAFDVVDLGITPLWQGQGIGGRLHDALLADQPYATAVLTALDAETVAMRMYLGRGWRAVLNNFYFPYNPEPYAILGLDLPASRGAAS